MSSTKFGYDGSGLQGERGPRGLPGIHVVDIDHDTEDDLLVFQMSNDTTIDVPFPGFTMSGVNDVLISGANSSTKFVIKNASNDSVLSMSTDKGGLQVNASLTTANSTLDNGIGDADIGGTLTVAGTVMCGSLNVTDSIQLASAVFNGNVAVSQMDDEELYCFMAQNYLG